MWRDASGTEWTIISSRESNGERGVWQRRFYEHRCRGEDDVQRCVDYIHVNPLKHGLVDRVRDWPWSSSHRYVRDGAYPIDWGNTYEWYGDEFKNAEQAMLGLIPAYARSELSASGVKASNNRRVLARTVFTP